MQDKWMNIGHENDELKPYSEPMPDFNDKNRLGMFADLTPSILSFVCDHRFHKRMPSESVQSTKSLPARCSVSLSLVRCRIEHARSTCCRVSGSLQCIQNAVFTRPQWNILSQHLVCWVRLLYCTLLLI